MNLSSRCMSCGGPMRVIAGSSDTECAMRCVAMGGRGSGWHAAQGHTKGSQGGGKKSGPVRDPHGLAHEKAATRHGGAARAHDEAAKTLSRPDAQTYLHGMTSRTGSSHMLAKREAEASTRAASKLSKEAGATKDNFNVEGAKTYAKMAREAKTPAEAAKFHREAAKYHRGAASVHEAFSKLKDNMKEAGKEVGKFTKDSTMTVAKAKA